MAARFPNADPIAADDERFDKGPAHRPFSVEDRIRCRFYQKWVILNREQKKYVDAEDNTIDGRKEEIQPESSGC